jgi:hypothetical protein
MGAAWFLGTGLDENHIFFLLGLYCCSTVMTVHDMHDNKLLPKMYEMRHTSIQISNQRPLKYGDVITANRTFP